MNISESTVKIKEIIIKDIARLIKKDRDFACSMLLTLYNCLMITDAIELSAIACAVKKTNTIDKDSYDYLKEALPQYAEQIMLHVAFDDLFGLSEFKIDKSAKKTKFFDIKNKERLRLEREMRTRDERFRLQQEAQKKRDEKKYRQRMETVKLQINNGVLKISFKYYEDFIEKIRSTSLFKWDRDGKFWYAPLSQEVIDSVLAMSFVPATEKDKLLMET